MRPVRGLQIALHVVLGIGALGAGQAFVRDRSGAALGMDSGWLDGSPFPDFLVPGLFLFLLSELRPEFLGCSWRRSTPFPRCKDDQWTVTEGLRIGQAGDVDLLKFFR